MFVDLGRADLEGDEPIYAFAVDSILETGDWLTPRAIPNDDAPFLEKPPLKFWIVAASIRSGLLPHDEFGQRFWDAAFGAIALLYVFAIGLRLGGPVCGLVAAFILFTHQPLVFVHGLRSQTMEAALVLSYCGGIYHALAWASSDRAAARRLHPLAVTAFFVLGFMTKFAAAVFLPGVLVLMPFAFARWHSRLREDYGAWLGAVAMAVLLCAPWFVYQNAEHGRAFWNVILGEHVYKRMTGSLDPGHVQPWHFYFSTIYHEFAGNKTLLPVAAGLLTLIVATVRRRWDAGVLILLWLIVPLTAISFGGSKLYHYAYPFLPPLALAAGYLPAVILRRDSPVYRLAGRWGTILSEGALRNQVRLLRPIGTVLAVLAFVVAGITFAYGRSELRVGDLLLFRNSSIIRPVLLGAVLMIVSSHGKLPGRLVLPLIVLAVLPLDAYRYAIARFDERGAPVKALAECLREQDATGKRRSVYVHAEDLGEWKYVYYFRRVGWQQPPERRADVLARKLLVPDEQQPVIVSDADYRSLKSSLTSPTVADAATERGRHTSILDTASVRLDDRWMLLLPGRYATCSVAAEHQSRTNESRAGAARFSAAGFHPIDH